MKQENKTTEEQIFSFFRKKKVATVDELIQFSGLSMRTIKRRLSLWMAYSSYTQNSSYYVLPGTPDFDGYGIWRLKEIGFSKHGNLRKTIIHLVETSRTGLSSRDLQVILGISVKSHLSQYMKDDAPMIREEESGRYIYFSKDSLDYSEQIRKRQVLREAQFTEKLPSDVAAIVILVERIKHQLDSLDQLTRRIRRRGVTISKEQVRNLLQHHGLLKKFWLLCSSSTETTHQPSE